MQRKQNWILAAVILFGCTSGFRAYAQSPDETTSSVPALESFHEVIFQIWHEAWPKKNAVLLQQLLPKVEKGISDVAAAKLPGILKDKKTVWDEGVRNLQRAGADYKAAAAAKDDSKLLAAAEDLHRRFEALMRAIRPVLDEMDRFHASLYMLYHHYLPNKDLGKIRTSAAELKQKMTALNDAKLPARWGEKDYEFQVSRALLSQSVEALSASVQSNDETVIKDGVEAVHSKYQALEKIFN
jgi:hypothetical protein